MPSGFFAKKNLTKIILFSSAKAASQNFCQTEEKLILYQIIPNIFIFTLTKTALKVGGGLDNSSHER